MNKKIITKILLVLLWMTAFCRADDCSRQSADTNNIEVKECPKADVNIADANLADANSVEAVLKQLNKKASELKSYEAQIEYKYLQPLLESEALRKGVLYYAKFETKSLLRINFETLKQEDEAEQKYIEHYIFDGRWLTQINYQIKTVKKYELAEPNKPVDAFDVASENLPIIGFTKIDNLKKQFEIKLIEQKTNEPNDFVGLHLDVKPGSVYKDDYVWIDFWIDKKSALPAKVIALSAEEDIYEIKLLKPKINKGIDKKVFEFKIPGGFGEPEIVPLKKKANKE